jgi:transglutaminase-like putative cysteine protease
MRLSIDHQTGFRYATRVKSSYNEARMTPAVTDHQTVWSSRLAIEPAAWSFSYIDYWGTAVTTFEVHEPHVTTDCARSGRCGDARG